MDEELDPDVGNSNSVLVQESSELFHILCCQSPSVIMSLCQMMPVEGGVHDGQPSVTDSVETMLKYFSMASPAECCSFLQRVCMTCENIPMHLESKLLSVAGYASSDHEDLTAGGTGLKSSAEEKLPKRPRIDYWEQYIQAVKRLLQRRWRRQAESLVKDVQPEKVWVNIRTANRGRERPDQTPGSVDRGSRTPEPDMDYGCLESRLTLETFLQECAGKVTVLCGQAGSGKSLLMTCLGQQWANDLGPIPSSSLFVLLEFRQLNLLSSPLSLSDLLFQHYLPPSDGDDDDDDDDDAKKAIVDYLLSNPEQSCWVLDGYDEFHRKLCRQTEPLDLDKPLAVADLISGLLHRQLLSQSTVLVTCRARDITDLNRLSENMGELLPWDHQEIKDYVDNFFGVKEGRLQTEAADLLLSSRHLLTMSSLPGLCNICCIFLKHLLLDGRDAEKMLDEKGSKERINIQETEDKDEGNEGGHTRRQQCRKSGDEETSVDGANSRSEPFSTAAHIPTTLTQVYLAVVAAYLSRYPCRGGRNDQIKTPSVSQSVVRALSQHSSELCELSRLAWRGLEENKILFEEEDVSQHVLEFSVKTGLFSPVEFRRHDGKLVNAYGFIHLTVQEFLAALRIMTSNDLTDEQLKRRFSLKSRWTTKTDQKTMFTDSLYLYVCGLASPHCIDALVLVARASGLKGVQSWVQKRQAHVQKLLKALCHSNTLTGPKILQLCHCVQESQNQELARQVVSARPTLELRNFCLLPSDVDALAFVVNSVGANGVGLDFGSCSMELECLDVLSRCRNIHSLSFRRRKYGDKFAEKLSTILPEFTSLRKLEFCGASLTAAGAASLASGLQNCPTITDINFSDNNLQDEGLRHVAEIFTKLQRLAAVTLGRNNTSLNALDYLVGKMSSNLNIQHVHADEKKELKITFFPDSDISSYKTNPEPTVSLLNQKWNKADIQKLAKSLTKCPALSVLDLSGSHWDEDTLKMLTQSVPKFNISEKIILNDGCTSVECLVILTALLSECPSVVELHIRLQSPAQVSVVFPGEREKPADPVSRKLCLSCCNLLPSDLERVWRNLGSSSGLTVLDLSCNRLGDKGLKKLLDVLPSLTEVQEVNFSDNSISMDGVVMLAGALASNYSLTDIQISDEGKDQVILQFSPDSSEDKLQRKMFRINNRSLLPFAVTKICKRLHQCPSHLELEFSRCSLAEKAMENLLKVLPKMSSLQRLDVSSSITSVAHALILVSCLTDSQRVTSVELSPQSESVIHFDPIKAEQVNCSLTGFCFNGDKTALMTRLLEILQQNQQLSYLDLSGNQLEDEGVKCLVDSLPRLKVTSFINLSQNRLTQRGLLDVVSTLCSCTNVSDVEISLGEDERCLIWFRQKKKTLRISKSSLERRHLLRLAEIVSDCASLTKLELQNNMLQSEWIENFVSLLNCSEGGFTLSIEESWIKAEEAVHLMCRCMMRRNIQTIRVHLTTLHLALKKNTALTAISLVDCSVNGKQLASMEDFIRQSSSLTDLDFSSNRLDIEGAEFLSFLLPLLLNLTSLSIGIKESTVSVVEELSHDFLLSTSIQHLNLSGHLISDAAAQSLIKLLPRLRSLNLSRCVWSEEGGLQLFKALSQCEHLEDLCLDATAQLNKNSWMCLAQALRNMNSMRALKLNEILKAPEQSEVDVVLDLLAGMEGFRQIKTIELDVWWMNHKGIEQLTKFLPKWKELRKLRLCKNLISDSSGEKLLDALRSCNQLEELHLSSNCLGDLTASKMSLVLPSMMRLTVLDISENRIGHEGSLSLSRAIRSLKNLRKIHLTSVGTSELSAVAASLGQCLFIQDVGLGWNNCGDDVVLELAKVLPVCHQLTRIDLECNCVSASGLEVLVKALKSCPALQTIRLWKNNLTMSETQMFSLREKRLNFSSIM